MIKNVSVFGLGKLGCSMAAVFAEKGFNVRGFDLDAAKVNAVREGHAPVFEAGLDDLVRNNRRRLTAVEQADEAVMGSEISFIVVPTPSSKEGGFETRYAAAAAKTIAAAMARKNSYHVVVLTSTVLPGASRRDIVSVLEDGSGKKCGRDFGFCYSPEFIALGSVIRDLMEPDYFLIGQFDTRSGDALEYVNRKVSGKEPTFCRMTIEEAELAKIATNSFITMKISFANYLAAICERLPNANVDRVTSAVGKDSRIGSKYLSGGLGFGGPCFPRDNVALAKFSDSLGVESATPLSVDSFNRAYSVRVARTVASLVDGAGRVGVVGLSYKPGSHVLEESASVAIVKALVERGQKVEGYDPLQDEFEKHLVPDFVKCSESLAGLVNFAEAVVLTHRDLELAEQLVAAVQASGKRVPIVDCWRIVDPERLAGLKLYRVGVTAL